MSCTIKHFSFTHFSFSFFMFFFNNIRGHPSKTSGRKGGECVGQSGRPRMRGRGGSAIIRTPSCFLASWFLAKNNIVWLKTLFLGVAVVRIGFHHPQIYFGFWTFLRSIRSGRPRWGGRGVQKVSFC